MTVKLTECRSTETLTSASEFGGTVVGKGAENGELWVGILLLTTGNNGCATGAGGVDEGSPGGVTCEGWTAGEEVDGGGALTFWTGNNGCWAYPIGAGGGTEIVGGCGYHGGRGGTGQPAGGTGTVEP